MDADLKKNAAVGIRKPEEKDFSPDFWILDSICVGPRKSVSEKIPVRCSHAQSEEKTFQDAPGQAADP
jgi:hypothetical protein